MNVRYDKKDLGLYVALGMIGVGLGVLGGALWASRRTKKKEVELTLGHTEDAEPVGKITSVEEVDGELIAKGEFTRPFYVEVEEVETGEKFPGKDSQEKDDDMENEELLIFIEEYGDAVTTPMLSMIESGIMDLEEARQRLDIAEEAKDILNEEGERYAYEAVYRPSPPPKPDLSDLVTLDEVEEPVKLIDDRYQIIGPDQVEEVTRAFTYLEGDPLQWSYMSARNYLVHITDLNKYVTNRAWGEIADRVLEGGIVYVFDTSTEKTYSFTLDEDDDDISERNDEV